MKSREMQVLFENKFRTLDKAGVRKYFNTNEIEDFLNESLFEYVRELIKVFEVNEIARKTLVSYTKRKSMKEVPASTIKIDRSSRFFKFSVSDIKDEREMMAVVEEHVITKDSKTVQVKPVSHDYFLANIHNKYKKPYKRLVWRLDIDMGDDINNVIKSSHELVSRDIDYSTYIITYVLKPKPISIKHNVEVLMNTIDITNIVNIAVSKAAQTLGLNTEKSV